MVIGQQPAGSSPEAARAHRLRPPAGPLTDGTVTLRPWVDADVDQIDDACQDPAIQRFIPIPSPYRREDAVRYVARTRWQWDQGTKAAFAIVDATDPTVLLGAIDIALAGAAGNAAYWVVPSARHRGVAVRALRLLTDWALHRVGLGVVILEIRPDNEASCRVAAECGYHRVGRLDLNRVTGDRGNLIFSKLAVEPPPVLLRSPPPARAEHPAAPRPPAPARPGGADPSSTALPHRR